MIEAQIKALEELLQQKESELNDQHKEVTYEGIPREALFEGNPELIQLLEIEQKQDLDELSPNSEDEHQPPTHN